jgi:hypothetical protein
MATWMSSTGEETLFINIAFLEGNHKEFGFFSHERGE